MDGGRLAHASNGSLKLPVGYPSYSAFAIAHGQQAFADPPLLTQTSLATSAPGFVAFTGRGFSSNGSVYLAIYDALGQRLYPNVWLTASPFSQLGGSNSASPTQQPVVASTSAGSFSVSLSGLCGSDLMARAYDAGTQTWSNWVDLTVTCEPSSPDANPTPQSSSPNQVTKR
jgi:hypothetical protein